MYLQELLSKTQSAEEVIIQPRSDEDPLCYAKPVMNDLKPNDDIYQAGDHVAALHGEEKGSAKVAEFTINYEAESPDELALVTTASQYGCKMLSRSKEAITVGLPGRLRSILFYHIQFFVFFWQNRWLRCNFENPACTSF